MDISRKLREGILNEFIISAIKIADTKKQGRLEREEHARQLEEEHRIRAEIERQCREEMEWRQDLENKAAVWAKSQQLRTYIQAVETAASSRPFSENFQRDCNNWLDWADQHTGQWKQRYKIRSGKEATMSELKRSHGFGRLRVRRAAKVRFAVACKVIACNIKRWARAYQGLYNTLNGYLKLILDRLGAIEAHYKPI
jgi:hypothetical protein